jgi:hypothetical protein
MPSNLSSSHLIALCKKRRVFGGSVGPGLLASFRRSGGHFGYGKVSQTLLLKQNNYETRRPATAGKVPTVKKSLLGGKRLDARRGGEVQLEMCVTYIRFTSSCPLPLWGRPLCRHVQKALPPSTPVSACAFWQMTSETVDCFPTSPPFGTTSNTQGPV